ncbi:MAG: FmdE, Molybdenum formylmethanofuran dehydrogenase operon [Methanoregulaceae archaeon PtaB.Bin108]|nr:MAG: FmdE, Molybdenum formylmethanofuran dehydrogenase operon [Methanoregulaceae archaeon PtaB.Bin108]OPY46294.1 MAG: FmdE, Molybdenum formylmethanofuran dehydrogenase operon [Methanoregulaceae archaeon PtaU1.Bin222]
MKNSFFFILIAVLLVSTPVMAALPDGNRMDELGQRAAFTAMSELRFGKGDWNVLVLTNAGRAVVDEQTTERAISGITRVTGLQNGDGTLYQVYRAEWKPLWFYFYDKKTGKGVYLEPDASFYTMSNSDLGATPFYESFAKKVVVTGDIESMLANQDVANETLKVLGGNAGSLIPMSNCWAHGAPYDLMSAAMLHDHLCPGVTAGYLIAKYVEEKMPITDGTSYTVIASPHWCKDDAFPVLWDITPGKGGPILIDLSKSDEEALKEKYHTSPAGVIVRWDSKQKIGQGIAVGFQWDNCTPWTGPQWAYNHGTAVEMMGDLDSPEKYVSAMKEFEVDQTMLADLKNPANNPYEVIGML